MTGLPSWPQSAQLNDAPSPEDTYSWPSGPNSIEPVECDGYCWHQSSINTVSVPLADSRESRPLITHPSAVGPGGVGHVSPQRGCVLTPGVLSYAYSTYTYGRPVVNCGSSAIPSSPRSQ